MKKPSDAIFENNFRLWLADVVRELSILDRRNYSTGLDEETHFARLGELLEMPEFYRRFRKSRNRRIQQLNQWFAGLLMDARESAKE